jgi:hypothetical protein
VNAPTWLISLTGSSEFLDVHVQNIGEPHYGAVAVDAALAALDLGQPRLGPADQSGEHGL